MPGMNWDKVGRQDRVTRHGSISVFEGLPDSTSPDKKGAKKKKKKGPTPTKKLLARPPKKLSLDVALLKVMTIQGSQSVSMGQIVQDVNAYTVNTYSEVQVRTRIAARPERFVLEAGRVRLIPIKGQSDRPKKVVRKRSV